MTAFFPLDHTGKLGLRISRGPQSMRVEITGPLGSLGRLERNLAGLLRLHDGKQAYGFETNQAPYHCDMPAGAESVQVTIRGVPFGSLRRDSNGEYRYAPRRLLTVFETRNIGQNPALALPKSEALSMEKLTLHRPLTDLHTHLSGEIAGKDLIEIGLARESSALAYPTALLASIGIREGVHYPRGVTVTIPRRIFNPLAHLEKPDAPTIENAVPLSALSPEALDRLEAALGAPIDRQITFGELELDIYHFRDPFVKDEKLLVPMLWAAARNYAKMGVRYSDQSVTSAIRPGWMERIHRVMPEITEETGTTLRFLQSIPRNFHPDLAMDWVKAAIALAPSPYLAGIDLVGYEGNKTYDLREPLEYFAKWAVENDDSLLLRVHAVETGKNPQNAREVLEIAKKYGPGENTRGLQVRIAHFLHGMDEETVRLAKALSDEERCLIEYNHPSNQTNNVIDHYSDVPIARALEEGIGCVNSSDGHGLYQVTADEIVQIAFHSGVTEKGFQTIRATEEKHIARQMAVFDRKMAAFPKGFFAGAACPVIHHTPARAAEIQRERDRAEQRFFAQLEEKNIRALPWDKIAEAFPNAIPLLVAGAGGRNWEPIPACVQKEIDACNLALTMLCDPKRVLFVGGRHKNVGVSHSLAKALEYSARKGKHFPLLGLLSEPLGEASVINPRLTHFSKIPGGLMAVPSAVIDWLGAQNGMAIFIGGGAFTRDFIVSSQNSQVPYFAMVNAPGASMEKGVLMDEAHRFTSARELLGHILDQGPALLRKDVDRDMIEETARHARWMLESPQANRFTSTLYR